MMKQITTRKTQIEQQEEEETKNDEKEVGH